MIRKVLTTAIISLLSLGALALAGPAVAEDSSVTTPPALTAGDFGGAGGTGLSGVLAPLAGKEISCSNYTSSTGTYTGRVRVTSDGRLQIKLDYYTAYTTGWLNANAVDWRGRYLTASATGLVMYVKNCNSDFYGGCTSIDLGIGCHATWPLN